MLSSRNFLMPDATIAIEILAFVVVLVVMTRYVLPRIRAVMQAREQGIARALADARDAEERRRIAELETAEIRAAARHEARTITDRARTTADRLVAEGRRAGAEEYRWLAGQANRELQRRTELARHQLRQQARSAATSAVRTYLGHEVDEACIERLVDRALDDSSQPVAGRPPVGIDHSDRELVAVGVAAQDPDRLAARGQPVSEDRAGRIGDLPAGPLHPGRGARHGCG